MADPKTNHLMCLLCLVTIQNSDEEVARRHNVTVTTRSRRSTSPRADSIGISPNSAVNPSRHDLETPPPSTRKKRASTPPGRNYSPRSKSSSDGSWDTPTASPPSTTRPPHARGTGASTSRRKSSSGNKETAQDISEAVYTKFWMCGFTDSFNFDNLKGPWRDIHREKPLQNNHCQMREMPLQNSHVCFGAIFTAK